MYIGTFICNKLYKEYVTYYDVYRNRIPVIETEKTRQPLKRAVR